MKTLIFILLAIFSFNSFAGGVTGNWTTINRIQLAWNSKHVFYFAQDIPNPYNCNGGRAVMEESLSNYNEVYSLSLAAFSAGNDVRFVVYDDQCSYNGYVKLLSIHARK